MSNRLSPGSLASGSLTYLLSNVLSAAVPLLLIPILTRHLTQAEYGQVGIFLGLVAGLAAFTGLNTGGAAAREFYDDATPERQRRFIGACLQILVASTLLLCLLAWLLREPATGLLGLDPAWLFLAIAVSAAGFVINLRLTQWQVRRQAVRFGLLQVLQAGLLLLLTLWLVVAWQQGAGGRILAQVLTATACVAIALHSLRRDGLLGWGRHGEDVRKALRFGVPLVPHIGGIFLLGMADRFFINAELGTDQTGIYVVAAQVSGIMAILFDAVNKAYVPWLFERLKRDDLQEKRRIVTLTYAGFAGALALALALALTGPALIHLLAGEEYRAAAEVIGWLALGQAFGGMYLLVTNYIFYSRRTGMLAVVTGASGMLNLLLLAALVVPLGLAGAAMAHAAAMAVRFGATWWLAQRRHPMPWLHFLQNKNAGAPHA